MAPNRKSLKRKAKVRGTMILRSSPLGKIQVPLEDGSSRVLPLSPPQKRPGRAKRCVYVDDEASVDRSIDEDSNTLLGTPNLKAPSLEKETLTPQSNTTRTLTLVQESRDEDIGQEEGDLVRKHKRVFGESVPLGLMNDVMSQFYVPCSTEPPLVPLCRLVATEAVRAALDEASWLIPLFDRAAYVKSMGAFTVSLKGRHGEVRKVTQEMIDKWDPIWQSMNADFERQLVGEWEALRGRLFYVWDGNHRLKTWMKRIEDGELSFFSLFH